jgi:hypothetical protein
MGMFGQVASLIQPEFREECLFAVHQCFESYAFEGLLVTDVIILIKHLTRFFLLTYMLHTGSEQFQLPTDGLPSQGVISCLLRGLRLLGHTLKTFIARDPGI